MSLDEKLKAAQEYGEKIKLTFDQIADVQGQIIANSNMTTAGMRSAAKEAKKFGDTLDSARDTTRVVMDLAAGMQKPFDKILNTTSQQLTAEMNMAKALKKKVADQKKSGALSASQADDLTESLNLTIKMNKAMSTIGGNKDLAGALAAGSDAAEEVQGAVDGIFANIPGGKAIQGMFGFDQIGDQIKGEMLSGLVSFNAAGKGSMGIFGGLKLMISSITKVLMANPLLAVVIAATTLLGLMSSIAGIAGDFEKKARAAAEAQGTSVTAMKQMALEAHNVSMSSGMTLANSEDILAVQGKIAESMGSSYAISAQTAGEIAETGKAFGVGVQASADFASNLMEAGASGIEAQEMLQGIGAELLGTGINAGAVIEDITKNAKLTGKYFKGSVKELKKAAVEAAKMGVSLDTMASVSDALLDVEGSLTAQFEFQAMTGKQMNLDKARQLALQGKTAEATKALLSEVGSLNDLQNMGPLQMQALEKATGMTADQMIRAATIQEKMPGMKDEELKLLEAQGMSIQDIANMSNAERQQALADAQSQAQVQKNMDKMKAQAMKALLPLGEALLSAFNALSPVLDVISGSFKLISSLIQGILAPVKIVYNVFKGIKDAIVGFMEQLGILQPMVDFLGFVFEAIKNTIMITGSILAVAFLPTILATIPAALSMAGSFIASAIPAIFTGFGMIPFGLGIPLAIGAVAGLIGTVAKYMSDGVISPSQGRAGYGDRVLFGPEGAISFNNKDTIVAGTNLNYGVNSRMNDGIIAPAGAIQVDDYAENGDPAEANVVQLSNDAAKKIGYAVDMGQKGLLGSLFGGGSEPAPTQLGEETIAKQIAGFGIAIATIVPALVAGMTMAVTAGNVAAYMTTMPMQIMAMTTGITAGMVAGAMATALIPKPVLIMNPILPVLETNPILIGAAMMDMMGGFLGSLFGGGKEEDPNAKIIAKLDEVIAAVSNIRVDMDGEKVGVLTRVANSFRSKTRSGV